jgi:hypothetical protein
MTGQVSGSAQTVMEEQNSIQGVDLLLIHDRTLQRKSQMSMNDSAPVSGTSDLLKKRYVGRQDVLSRTRVLERQGRGDWFRSVAVSNMESVSCPE